MGVTESMDLVSVIIPHYKVDMIYLRICLESIIAQTWQNLEIIIVDDGNEADMAVQIDKMALMDERISVLHQKNSGVSVARNAAMKAARGAWITFCDPDDWMSPDKVETLLSCAKKNRADIVFGRYHQLVNDKDLEQDCDREFVFEAGGGIEELIRKLLLINGIVQLEKMIFKLAVVWGGIYSRDILELVRFPERMHPVEDEIFNLYALKNARKVVFVGKKLHYYRNNAGIGVMRNFQANTLQNYQYAEWERQRFLEKRYGAAEKYFNSKEVAFRSLKILIILCKSYFFHSNNPESYRIRKTRLTKYIQENMPYFRNIRAKDILSEKDCLKYLCFWGMLKGKVYFPLELCWHGTGNRGNKSK